MLLSIALASTVNDFIKQRLKGIVFVITVYFLQIILGLL